MRRQAVIQPANNTYPNLNKARGVIDNRKRGSFDANTPNWQFLLGGVHTGLHAKVSRRPCPGILDTSRARFRAARISPIRCIVRFAHLDERARGRLSLLVVRARIWGQYLLSAQLAAICGRNAACQQR